MERPAIDRITAAQHSLITTGQFLEVTRSEDALRWAVRDGWLEPYRRGVYIVAGAPRTDFQPICAACLRGGPTAGASGLAAGWLLGSPDILPGALDITIFGGAPARRIRNVTVHRCGLPAQEWLTTRYGIPTTVPALAVVQLAKMRMEFLAERLFNHLTKRKRVGAVSVLRALDATGYRGPDIDKLRAFCEKAVKVRGHDDSPAARDLAAALIDAGLAPFETQYQVVVGGRVYLLDIAWPEYKVALEYHGWEDHAITRTSFDNDAARRSRLTAVGWSVLDVTSGVSDAEAIQWVRTALGATRFPVS
jgi:very-short-patch-repair endonuclease